MDAVTGILLVANTVAIVDNLYRFFSLLRLGDPTTNRLFALFITESARFAVWKRRLRIDREEDVGALVEALPEDTRSFLPEILEPMSAYVRDVEALFKKYRIQPFGKQVQRNKLGDTVRKIRLQLDGVAKIEEILKAFQAANDALVAIAPPPPYYHVSVTHHGYLSHGMRRLSPYDEPGQQGTDDRRSASFASPSYHAYDEQETFAEDGVTEGPAHASEGSTHPLVELLYLNDIVVLVDLSESSPHVKDQFRALTRRLHLWGYGIVKGDVTIDEAIVCLSQSGPLLKEAIAGCLADIAVILLEISAILQIDDSRVSLQLQELLAIDEVSRLPIYTADEEDEELRPSDDAQAIRELLARVDDLIGTLYDVLPAIERSLFQTWLETRRSQAKPVASVTAVHDLAVPEQSPSTLKDSVSKDLLTADLELINAIRETLLDSKYAKYLVDKDPRLDMGKVRDQSAKDGAAVKNLATSLIHWNDKEPGSQDARLAVQFSLARLAQSCSKCITTILPIQ